MAERGYFESNKPWNNIKLKVVEFRLQGVFLSALLVLFRRGLWFPIRGFEPSLLTLLNRLGD
jgi:hypothetical protein